MRQGVAPIDAVCEEKKVIINVITRAYLYNNNILISFGATDVMVIGRRARKIDIYYNDDNISLDGKYFLTHEKYDMFYGGVCVLTYRFYTGCRTNNIHIARGFGLYENPVDLRQKPGYVMLPLSIFGPLCKHLRKIECLNVDKNDMSRVVGLMPIIRKY